MIIASSDITLFEAANMPAADTGASGGALSATELTGVLNEAWSTFIYEAAGGSDITWYYKLFVKNKHATSTLSNITYWLPNCLIPSVAAGQLSLVSTSASDNNTYKVRAYYKDSYGSYTYEDITLNGTSSVTSVNSMAIGSIQKLELLTSGGALTVANGDITATRGIVLGKIPAGYDFATAEVSFALETNGVSVVADGTNSATNRLTEPTNITAWSNANVIGSALAGPDLAAGSAQGVWFRITGIAGYTPVAQNRLIVQTHGTSPA